jgi:hypothetical protein
MEEGARINIFSPCDADTAAWEPHCENQCSRPQVGKLKLQ